jgi:tRNA A37 threonylcarbamoyladenosine dehydratase
MDQKAFKPSIFGNSTEKARATFDEWYRKRKDSLLIHDDFITQLKDLIKTRNPSRSLSESDYEEEINSYRVGRDLQNCGCWVYYPWSSRLVHLLGKSEFTELRTNRNRYKIMPDEQQVLEKKRVGVVGLSVGQSVAIAMTLERSYGLIRLADFDTLDLSNMNRIRTGVHNLGLPKALLTAREIAEIDPYVEVECFLDGLTEANIEHFLRGNDTRTPLDVLVDECDDLAMKVLMRQRARQLRIPVVMDTSDRGMLDVERFDLEPSRPIFHGITDDLEYRKLKGLTTEQKIPYVMKFIGGIENTPRMAASLMEIGQTISTWPQLASDVLLGGAIAAETIRRIHLRQFQGSGRYFVCPQEIISDPLSTSTNEGTSDTLHPRR